VVYNISDPMSPVLKKMFRDRNRFYQIVAKDSVDMFLDYTFRSRIGKYVYTGAYHTAMYHGQPAIDSRSLRMDAADC